MWLTSRVDLPHFVSYLHPAFSPQIMQALCERLKAQVRAEDQEWFLMNSTEQAFEHH